MSKQTENMFWVTADTVTWELQQRTNHSSAKPPENICSDAFDLVAKPHLGSAFAEGFRKSDLFVLVPWQNNFGGFATHFGEADHKGDEGLLAAAGGR